MPQMLLLGNPRRRRKHRKAHAKRRHHRRHAGMFTANPRRRRSHRRHARRSAPVVVVRNPSRRHRRYARAARAHGMRAMGLVKAGLWGGAGALTVDLVMGTAGAMLPAAFSQPTNATTGGTNWGYYATKGALALGLAMFGKKIIPATVAAEMGAGAITVVAYQIMRGLVPAGTLPLGAAPSFAPGSFHPGMYAPRGAPALAGVRMNVPGMAGVRVPLRAVGAFKRPNQ